MMELDRPLFGAARMSWVDETSSVSSPKFRRVQQTRPFRCLNWFVERDERRESLD